jgi:succinate-semialdehyde dehydrogenase/glutarate-semialdehyde dehydrogenase
MSTSTTINPTTEEVLTTFDDHTDAEVEAIVEAAHNAFSDWRRRPLKERADVIREIASLLRERSDELAKVMTDEMGKVLAHGKREIELCAQICEWTADNAARELDEEERPLDGGRAIITYQPVGIIFGIQPFNFPAYQVIRYSIPQLVAGNAVLLKHAHSVWGSAMFLERLYHDAGVPADLFRALKISSDQSNDLIAHPLIRGVTLTGSGNAGSVVAAEAGKHLKKTVMEFGSNDAYLVLADADIATAVEVCTRARIYNNGETCVAAKRFVVVDAIYDEFVAAFVEQLETIEVGDPNDEATDLGPMAREDLRDGLHEQVMASVDSGAKLTMGGTIPDQPGFFYPVTVLEDVTPGMPAYDDELFGPVAAIIRVADDSEAMRVANDSRFGLGGGIISADVDKAIAMAIDEFDTGMININGYNLANPQLPFGGVKDSGYGREHGGFGLKEFVNVKSIQVTES